MTKRTVYKYPGENGVVISPVKITNTPCEELVRLIASTGKILTNNISEPTSCIDVMPDEVANWLEIEEPESEEQGEA